MKKLLILLFACTGLYAQELHIEDFSAGKVDAYDATRIPDNAVADVRNVWFDGNTIAEKRNGMTVLNSVQLGDGKGIKNQFEYKMSDGTRYHIVDSSETVYYRLSGSEWTVLKNEISATYPCNYVVFMDTLTVVDGVNNMWSWDTSTTFTQESTYQPRFIIVWQNRIWIAGDSGERSKVRCSEWLDPSDYTVPATPIYTDPAVFDINSQDGQKVMGFFLSPNGNLGILKENSVWEIGGYDRSDFFQRLVLNDVGCIDSGGVEYKEGVVQWLSKDGFVGYDGQTYSFISDNISSTIDAIQQLTVGTGSFKKDRQGQWNTYSSTDNIDTTTNPGSIVLDYKLDGNSAYGISNLQRNSTNYFHFCYGNVAGTSIKEDTFQTGIFTVNKTIDTGTNLLLNATMTDSFVMDSSDNKHLLYWTSGSGYNVMYASASYSSDWSTSTIKTDTVDTGVGAAISINLDTSGNPHIIFSSEPASSYDFQLLYSSHNGTNWTTNVEVEDIGAKQAIIKISSDDTVHVVWVDQTGSSTYVLKYSSCAGGESTFSEKTFTTPATIDNASIGLDYDSNDNPYISFVSGGDLYISSYTGTGAIWTTTKILDLIGNSATGSNIKIDSSENIGIIYKLTSGSYNYLYYMRYDATAKVWSGGDLFEFSTDAWNFFDNNFDESDNPIA